MARQDEISSQWVAVVGVVVAAALFSFVVAIQVLYYVLEEREYESKIVRPPIPETAAVLVQQQESLAGYRWVDRHKGVVAIPVERAMELVVQRYATGESQ